MSEHSIQIKFKVFDQLTGLSQPDQELIEQAKQAVQNAYAPYSNFKVGAAIRLANEGIVVGNNQENASYPAGLCAEQNAIFHVGSNYPNEIIEAIAIATESKLGTSTHPIAPCGICRQVLMEYENKQKSNIRILLVNGDETVTQVLSSKDLMPFSFGSKFLK